MRIGTKPRGEASGFLDLLRDCHQRIRAFADLAKRLAEVDSPLDTEIVDAAHGVRRYFAEALPLHVEDEEHTLLPRLRGRSDEIDAALDRMSEEHLSHDRDVCALLALCAELEASPSRLGEVRAPLRSLSGRLREELERHLLGEEELLFPAVERWITVEEQQEMIAELRQRRSTS